jgi:predicted enzyme related to lactoylglutathione lyase
MTLGRMTVAKDTTGAHFSIWESKDHAGVGIAAVPGTECWAELITDNPKAAMKFYENVFDWGFSEGQNGYIHIRTGEQYIGGVQTPEQHAQRIPPHWLLYFEVGDIDGATAKAQNLGGTVRIPPTDVPGAGRYALIFDPAGADFALWSSPR